MADCETTVQPAPIPSISAPSMQTSKSRELAAAEKTVHPSIVITRKTMVPWRLPRRSNRYPPSSGVIWHLCEWWRIQEPRGEVFIEVCASC